MSVFNSVSDVISSYGSKVTVRAEGGFKSVTKAFVQPIRRNSNYYSAGKYRKGGFVSTSRFLYIGCPDTALEPNRTVIETNGSEYIVKRSEIYRMGEEDIYVWAVLAPYKSALEDEYE